MEPLRTTIDDCAINSKYNDIIHSSRVLSIRVVRCDDQVFNRIIKQENIENQVFNEIIKEEIIDKTEHHNDSQLLQKDSKVEPFPLNIICGDQVLDGINKQKNIDSQIFNRIIKEEIIDETEHHNDSQLLQKDSKVEPFPLNIICGDQVFDGINKQKNIDSQIFNRIIKEEIIDETEHHNDSQLLQNGTKTEEERNSIDTEMIKIKVDFIDNQEFKGTVLNKNNTSELITGMNLNKTSESIRENPFNDICDKISTASNLTVHNRTHDGRKPHKCDFCGLRFSKVSDLTRHTRTHTREKPYICDTCDTAFARASVLIRHNKIHAREQPYQCAICGIRFSRASHLTVHTRTHVIEKQYKCNICDQAYFKPYNLKIHKRTHKGKKPRKCDICDSGFSKTSHLTRHKRTHTGEKPYICDFCDRAFAQKYNLTTHKRTHTGEKPYECDICGIRFSDASNLTKHSRKSHNVKKALPL